MPSASIQLTWVGGESFVGVDSTNHTIVLSPPGGTGVRPSDALLLALASCAAVEVVAIVAKQRAKLSALRIDVAAEQRQTHPRAFTHIRLRFSAHAEGLRAAQLQRAVDLALNKYCPVRASLSPEIAIAVDLELHETATATSSMRDLEE
jgi:putative redox protein